MNTQLSRLHRVPLRNAWRTEAGDFTPWLAKEENIELLSDAIGLTLEVEAEEKQVGPFRADILCKDLTTNSWVLVENQLERTDHTHLGQLMTYAAGLQAVTIVWISERFTDEHRAALDWLNDITSETFYFFGLEVELWRIGESPVAPKFNVVCKPNEWSRSVTGAASRIQTEELTETKKIQLEYWTRFRGLMESTECRIRPTKPMPQHWINFAIGRSYFSLSVFMNTRDNRIGAILILSGENAKPHFHLLAKEKDRFDKEFGEPLNWREMADKKESHISIKKPDTDPTDRVNWDEQHQWLLSKLHRFHEVFASAIKELDANDFENDSDFD